MPRLPKISIIEISDMRVRDIKRRLARVHMYDATEIANMIDKKELVNALAFEEHKSWQKMNENRKRGGIRRSIIIALICIILLIFRGLVFHVLEVVSVNFLVYTDKKKHEFSCCRKYRSIKGTFGILLMIILDILQVWLTGSVLLSWVMTSDYFFPMPQLNFRIGDFMATTSNRVAHTGRGTLSYGLNLAPMVVTWILRMIYIQLRKWMGQTLENSKRRHKKKKGQTEKGK